MDSLRVPQCPLWSKEKLTRSASPVSPWLRALALPPPQKREVSKHRNTHQDDEHSIVGIRPVIPERVSQQRRCHDYKHRRHEGISPHAVRPRRLRLAPPEDKHGARRDHIKEPLGKNRQRKQLPEICPQQQQ